MINKPIPMHERSGTNGGGEYRYGFNGMESIDEMIGNENGYDFGARMYDGRLGRWWSVDKMFGDYLSLSTYCFVSNQPLVAIDPDGNKILFVNGYWCSGLCGDIVGADEGGRGYWASGFEEGAKQFFRDYALITDNNFIDGSSFFGGDEDGTDRFEKGREYAETHFELLKADLAEGETVKLIGHSEGCAMSAGIASYLIEKGISVEMIVHLSPDEASDFNTPESPLTYQIEYDDDPVTVHSVIEGVDKSGMIHDSSKGLLSQHGSTGSASIFQRINDLKTVEFQYFLTWCNNISDEENPSVLPCQLEGSAPNGTVFSEINGVELYDKETCEPID